MQVRLKNNKGFILLEVLIAAALIGIAFVALLGIAARVINLSASIKNTTQADLLIKEEIESLRAYRDATTWTGAGGLGLVSTGTSNPYHTALDTSVSPAKWTLVLGQETTGSFSRSIIFDKVYRDANFNIAESGTLDADSIKVTVKVVSSEKTYQVIIYLTNWQK